MYIVKRESIIFQCGVRYLWRQVLRAKFSDNCSQLKGMRNRWKFCWVCKVHCRTLVSLIQIFTKIVDWVMLLAPHLYQYQRRHRTLQNLCEMRRYMTRPSDFFFLISLIAFAIAFDHLNSRCFIQYVMGAMIVPNY